MIKNVNPVERDERTIAIESKSYSIGYKLALYALLLDTMYRAFFLHQPSWDLLGIVTVCGLITSLYQLNHKILTRSWVKVSLLAFAIAIIIAAFIAAVSKGLFS